MISDSRQPSEHEVRTVLVVEDELLVRLAVAEELREAGMRVIEAGNADEAMKHLRAGNAVDLVFADIELPGSMNGLELARRLRTDFPDIKLLVTSGRLPEPEATSAGAFIAKPYDIAEVVGRIRATLDNKQPNERRQPPSGRASHASHGRSRRPCSATDRGISAGVRI